MVLSKYLTISAVLQHYTSEETCLSTFQSPIDPSTILGGFPGSNFTEVNMQLHLFGNKNHFTDSLFWYPTFPYQLTVAWQASAFVITYPVNNKVETTGQENGKAVAWERAYINLVKVGNSHSISKLMCSASSCPYSRRLPLIDTCSIQVDSPTFIFKQFPWHISVLPHCPCLKNKTINLFWGLVK